MAVEMEGFHTIPWLCAKTMQIPTLIRSRN